jgi:hypothetical protein
MATDAAIASPHVKITRLHAGKRLRQCDAIQMFVIKLL